MNKLFKGAIASAAGVALLLGGAGTFAVWKDFANFGNDRSINAGELRFDLDDHEMPPADWAINGIPVLDSDDPGDSTAEEIEAVRFVPGDTVTMTWNNVPLIVTGDYIAAEFGVSLDPLGQLSPAQAAFMTDIAHTVQVHDPSTNSSDPDSPNYWSTPGATVPIGAGRHALKVLATVHFRADAEDQLAYGAEIPLTGLGLTVEQVPHQVHIDYGYTPPPREP